MIKQNLSGTTEQLNSTVSGGNKQKITSSLEKSLGAVGEYVDKRLSIYPQTNPTKETRKVMSLYVDNNGVSSRVSLQQIKDMNTKILVADSAKNINNLDIGDFIFSKE